MYRCGCVVDIGAVLKFGSFAKWRYGRWHPFDDYGSFRISDENVPGYLPLTLGTIQHALLQDLRRRIAVDATPCDGLIFPRSLFVLGFPVPRF